MGKVTDAVIKDLSVVDDTVQESDDLLKQAGKTLGEEREGIISAASIEGKKRFLQTRLFLKYIKVDFEFFTSNDHSFKG